MRHPYSTNSTERKDVPSYLAILSVVTSVAMAALFTKIGWTPPAYVDVSSVMFVYGLYYGFFKRVGWKWAWPRTLGLISTPILEGTWSGIVQSDYDGDNRPAHNVEVIIGQDWTDILIRLRGPKSHSHSIAGSMVVTEDECVLIYEYLNEPNADAVETMHMHRGTARLVLTRNGDLEGDYYTGRGRKNTGGMKLQRKN
jgi:SMODS-associating 2TM, beta-strand rich effector domain